MTKKVFNSTITDPSKREIELVACLEASMRKLSEAVFYINHLGGASEAINDFSSLDPNVYLSQHGVKINFSL